MYQFTGTVFTSEGDWSDLAAESTDLSGYYTKSEVDTELDDYYTKSEVDTELLSKQDLLVFDTTPTEESTNPVTSEGIKDYIDGAISESSVNGVIVTSDYINIGPNLGTTDGFMSTKVGFRNTATLDSSLAIGYENTVTGKFSSAIGYHNISSNKHTSAFGAYNEVLGKHSVAIGDSNYVESNYSTAIGYKNKVSHDYAVTIGYKAVSTNAGRIVLGGEFTFEYNGVNSKSHQTVNIPQLAGTGYRNIGVDSTGTLVDLSLQSSTITPEEGSTVTVSDNSVYEIKIANEETNDDPASIVTEFTIELDEVEDNWIDRNKTSLIQITSNSWEVIVKLIDSDGTGLKPSTIIVPAMTLYEIIIFRNTVVSGKITDL